MNGVLNEIISDGATIEECINWELLRKHTREVKPDYLENGIFHLFQWHKLCNLHILGCDESDELKYVSHGSKVQTRCWVDKHNEWLLIIGASQTQIKEYLQRCSYNLRLLTIRFTTLESLSIGWGSFVTQIDLNCNPNLYKLDLSNSNVYRILLNQPLPKLEYLYAKHSHLSDVDFLRYLPGLQILDISNTFVTNLEPLTHCPNLRGLTAHSIKATSFPSLNSHEKLTSIDLRFTSVARLDDILFPPNLQTLSLRGTHIHEIPVGLRNLMKLQYLGLRDLQLDELPNWIPDWLSENELLKIDLRGTAIAGHNANVFNQPWEIVRQWLIERKNIEEGNALNELKIVFLGDGGAGKSYTIARLLADGEQPEAFSGDSTPGIVITDKEYTIGDRNVQIHFWDFGGQEILHSMHRMFLTDRTLYVVVLNVRDGTQDERARYWLHNIKSFAGNAPVLVVLNQMDENPNASINENDLRGISPGMTEVVKLSALRYSREEFNTAFTAALLRQIGRMSETLDFFFPAAWTKVKQSLRTMEQNYIHGDRYAAICEECGVKDEGDLRKSLLQWFNDLGVSFCYGDARLEDYVILRPDWLTNAIYILLFNKLENVRNGIVPLQTIFKVLNDRDKIRRVLPDVTYNRDEVSYVLDVVRKFRLSFPVNNDEEFIPMLCDRNSLPVASEYEKDPATLEFRMEYEYLPNNVLHRLMVELRGHLDTENVWLTGARFAQTSTGLSAVVKSEGNVLRIFVRSTKKLHPVNTYLSFIKDAVDQINQDMGLTPPVNVVIYKVDGITEEFNYDELVMSLEYGVTTRFSTKHKKLLKIEDILNQTGHVADEARDKLLQDIKTACMSMQSQKLYWNLPDDEKHSKENVRNDYIRELLRGKGYITSDQSRSGLSAEGKQAGLLDIDIRLKPDVPWTIFEALNITGTAKKDMDRWDEHLKKLLDNYNPMGLSYLFLVSYLECSKNDFLHITAAYDEHMRWHDPKNYERSPSSFVKLSTDYGQYISTAKCTYDRGGIPTTVYHICVRLGD